MTPTSLTFACQCCGLKARGVLAEAPDPNRIEPVTDFRDWCRVVPQPTDARHCPELRSAIDRLRV
jgi:hypothetical protein